MMNGPLEGVRVLSLAEQFPGPYATLLMADLGADVVIVERPGTGDPARAFPAFFNAIFRNKRSVCLDLKGAEDKARFVELAKSADVVLEGYSPGTVARLGVAYDDLKEVNPRLVYASLSGYGQTGPYRDRPAHDLSYQGVAGLLRSDPSEGDIPMLPLGDIAGAMFTAYAIVSALYACEKSGHGTYIDVSIADGLVSWMTPFLVPAMNGGEQIDVVNGPAYGVFATSDERALTLSIAHEDHFWQRLCHVLGLAEHADLTHPERITRSAALRAALQERIARKALAHWASDFDEHRIPWGPVNQRAEAMSDPQFVSRGLYRELASADGRTEKHILAPLIFSAYACSIRRPAPLLGESQEEIVWCADRTTD